MTSGLLLVRLPIPKNYTGRVTASGIFCTDGSFVVSTKIKGCELDEPQMMIAK
jgi:hypothetical protein